jgi:hypothetical protein
VTDQFEPPKICPILSIGPSSKTEFCIQGSCAWWDSDSQQCILLTLGRRAVQAGVLPSPPVGLPQPEMSNPPSPASGGGAGLVSSPASSPPAEQKPSQEKREEGKIQTCRDCKYYMDPRWKGDYAYCTRIRRPLVRSNFPRCELFQPKQ